MKWLELIKFLTPIILSAINPHLGQAANSIVQGIAEAEQIKGASSQDKLNHAVNITNSAVAAINAGTGKTLIDPVIVNAAAGHAISTIVDVTNLLAKSPANISSGAD